jgi:sulfate transporter 2, low-affinity
MGTSAAVESSAAMSTLEVSKRPETAKLVLNSPKPPSLREELVGVFGKAFRPRAASGAGAGGRQPRWSWVLTALQCVFPVLQWFRNYNLKAFKGDVMAGLTLASLGIPQVRGFSTHFLAGTTGDVTLVYTEFTLQFMFLLPMLCTRFKSVVNW